MQKRRLVYLIWIGLLLAQVSCRKKMIEPSFGGVAAVTVVNAIPNSSPVIPVFNTAQSIMYFLNAEAIWYGGFYEYALPGGADTAYVIQQSGDTSTIGPKTTGVLFYDVLKLRNSGVYSLFLCGSDTSAPDYFLTADTLRVFGQTDSSIGIRFVNLSAGSQPFSINLEGLSNGSVTQSLSYKSATDFGSYVCNSATFDYVFVVRDALTGDSLTQYDFGGVNGGYGLLDYNGQLLTFKNVTIAIYGSLNDPINSLTTMLVDNY